MKRLAKYHSGDAVSPEASAISTACQWGAVARGRRHHEPATYQIQFASTATAALRRKAEFQQSNGERLQHGSLARTRAPRAPCGSRETPRLSTTSLPLIGWPAAMRR